MRILHFNIRGYRMRILYILLYYGYENQFRPQMIKKTQKIMQLLKLWMKMQLMKETLRYDVLNNETIYKRKNLLKQIYFTEIYNFKNS